MKPSDSANLNVHHIRTQSMLDRVGARIDALPPSVKPIFLGPLVLIFLMKIRGAFLFGPVVVLFLLIQSDRPVHTFLVGASILGTLLLASAVGGLVYGLVGRRVKHIPAIGPYVAGAFSVAPYVLALWYITRVDDATPLFAPLDSWDIFGIVFISLLFGSFLGHALFKHRPEKVD